MVSSENGPAGELALGLLTAYGNLVSTIAAAAVGGGVPLESVRTILVRLDQLNRDTIESEGTANLLSERLALTLAMLDKQAG